MDLAAKCFKNLGFSFEDENCDQLWPLSNGIPDIPDIPDMDMAL